MLTYKQIHSLDDIGVMIAIQTHSSSTLWPENESSKLDVLSSDTGRLTPPACPDFLICILLQFYEQMDRVTMGSPLLPMVVNYVMEDFTE
jgi:hypothetical protein